MKRFFYRLLLFIGFSAGLSVGLLAVSYAQVPSHQDTTAMFINVVEEPSYPGGISELKKYLMANVAYPAAADSAQIKGRVFVSFIIEIDGQLMDITVLKGLGYGCDEEAVRVVRMMPRWIPGRQSGKLVRVRYNLPILFGLAYSTRKGVF